MNINGLTLPPELEADLKSGGHKLSDGELSRLKTLLNCVESPLPILFNYEEIVNANQLWESESAGDYLGRANGVVVPGDIDPARTLIFGESDPDSPIALDYRTDEPRVVYYGDVDYVCYWIELSSNYKSLFEMLQKETI